MKRTALLAVTAALGLAAALGYTAKPANAWDIASLPAPYTVSLQVDASAGDCPQFYVVSHYDKQARINFGTNSHGSDCNSHFQEQLDGFVDATINDPAPVTTTVPTTTDAVTTTATTPDTPPAPTTTTAPVQTVTVTDPVIEQRIAALEASYAALAKRVDAIATANTASWTAYIDAVNAGASAADAALAARSAGLDAIYQLG